MTMHVQTSRRTWNLDCDGEIRETVASPQAYLKYDDLFSTHLVVSTLKKSINPWGLVTRLENNGTKAHIVLKLSIECNIS